MNYNKIAEILEYTKPSKVAKPKGFSHRMTKWVEIVMEFADTISNQNTRENFLVSCNYYDKRSTDEQRKV